MANLLTTWGWFMDKSVRKAVTEMQLSIIFSYFVVWRNIKRECYLVSHVSWHDIQSHWWLTVRSVLDLVYAVSVYVCNNPGLFSRWTNKAKDLRGSQTNRRLKAAQYWETRDCSYQDQKCFAYSPHFLKVAPRESFPVHGRLFNSDSGGGFLYTFVN